MNRFRFRLQGVLRYREAQEESKKREFGATIGHLKHEEAHYSKIVNDIDKHDDLREKSGKGKILAINLIRNFYYSRSLERKKSDQSKAVETAQEAVDEKRVELVETTKKKKTLERLRERRLEEHNKEVIKEEQALIDEIATQGQNKREVK